MTGIWEPFEFLQRACDAAGFRAGFDADVVYGADCAASHWYDPNTGLYTLDSKTYCRDSLVGLYKKVAGKYPIGSLEDPLEEDDFEGFAAVTRELPETQIVGDDLFVTNSEGLRTGIDPHYPDDHVI